jgi:hypothetical protein
MDVYKLGAEAKGYRTVTIPYADVYRLSNGVCEGVNGYSTAAAYTHAPGCASNTGNMDTTTPWSASTT